MTTQDVIAALLCYVMIAGVITWPLVVAARILLERWRSVRLARKVRATVTDPRIAGTIADRSLARRIADRTLRDAARKPERTWISHPAHPLPMGAPARPLTPIEVDRILAQLPEHESDA